MIYVFIQTLKHILELEHEIGDKHTVFHVSFGGSLSQFSYIRDNFILTFFAHKDGFHMTKFVDVTILSEWYFKTQNELDIVIDHIFDIHQLIEDNIVFGDKEFDTLAKMSYREYKLHIREQKLKRIIGE